MHSSPRKKVLRKDRRGKSTITLAASSSSDLTLTASCQECRLTLSLTWPEGIWPSNQSNVIVLLLDWKQYGHSLAWREMTGVPGKATTSFVLTAKFRGSALGSWTTHFSLPAPSYRSKTYPFVLLSVLIDTFRQRIIASNGSNFFVLSWFIPKMRRWIKYLQEESHGLDGMVTLVQHSG